MEILDLEHIDNDIITRQLVLDILSQSNQSINDIIHVKLPFKQPTAYLTLDDYCFSDFINLRNFNYDGKILKIGNYAFKNCTSLSYVYILNCKYIGNYAFLNSAFSGYKRDDNTYQLLLDSCEYIGKCAFENNTNINRCSFGDLDRDIIIDDGAFNGCVNLEYIDSGVFITSLGCNSFSHTNLKSVNLNKCKTIKNYAFDGCTNFPSKIDLLGCTEIGRYAFRGCKNLESLIAPNCTFVDYNAFYGTKLWDVEPS